MWKTVYPEEGEWFHINNLLQVGEVYQYLLDNYHRAKIVAVIASGDDTQKVEFKDRSKVEWFKAFAKNWCGTDKLKIKVSVYEDT